METENQNKPRRGRPPASESKQSANRKRRRRNPAIDASYNQTLYLPEDLKDPDYVYYWEKNIPSKIAQRQAQDWEVVDKSELSVDTISADSSIQRVGNKTEGNNHILIKKKKEFHYQDFDSEQKRQDEVMNAIFNKGDAPVNNIHGRVTENEFTTEDKRWYMPRAKNIPSA